VLVEWNVEVTQSRFILTGHSRRINYAIGICHERKIVDTDRIIKFVAWKTKVKFYAWTKHKALLALIDNDE